MMEHDLELRATRLSQAALTLARDDNWKAGVRNLAEDIIAAYDRSAGIYLAGNGGSAAQADHFAAELVGRFESNERPPIGAMALLSPATMTALVNDFSPQDMFARMAHGLLGMNDMLILLTTSGTSENLRRAAQAAHEACDLVHVITGRKRPWMGDMDAAVIELDLDGDDSTALTQELTLLTIHSICGQVDHLAEERYG